MKDISLLKYRNKYKTFTQCRFNVGPGLRRQPNIKPALGERLVSLQLKILCMKEINKIQQCKHDKNAIICKACNVCNNTFSQKTQNICITFVQRRPNVFDGGPTLYKCHTNVLCLLGYWVLC